MYVNMHVIRCFLLHFFTAQFDCLCFPKLQQAKAKKKKKGKTERDWSGENSFIFPNKHTYPYKAKKILQHYACIFESIYFKVLCNFNVIQS